MAYKEGSPAIPISRPAELSKDDMLVWSYGKGTDVWEMFCATLTGDVQTIETLLAKDPGLIRCEYDYHTPMFFAVRYNQLEAASLLLARGANPVSSGTGDTLITIARDCGYKEMEALIESALSTPGAATPEGEAIAEAVRSRDLSRVRGLLAENPAMVYARNENTNQPIHWAAMTRQLDIIDELLISGADINAKRADGARPVQLVNGDYGFRGWTKDFHTKPREVLNHLRAKGAYIDICIASAIGDIDRVRELLDEDATLANTTSDYVSYYVGSGSPLNNAAAGGYIDIVRLLLERGADPNLREEGIAPFGFALYSAASNGHIEIAKLLLEHGAYPNPPVESSADALSMAISKDNKPMIELLCSYGAARKLNLLAYYGDIVTAAAVFDADPALANNADALENAAGQGRDAFVRLMLRCQPTLATQIGVGVTAQGPMDAVKSRELTLFLFEKGMSPNFKNWLGITPLHRFAQRGDENNAALFLEKGADIEARDEEIRSTPLGWAAKQGRLAMVELLLKHGANPNPTGGPAWATPLAWATRRGHKEVANLLKRHGAV